MAMIGLWADEPLSAQVTGANVTEAVDVELHVDRDNPQADDRNAGTLAAPLATVGEGVRRALANRAASLATAVRVHPGVYRERVELHPSTLARLAPTIIIEGTGPGETILAGSDVWSGWKVAGPGLWERPWNERFGLAPIPEGWDYVRDQLEREPVIRRREVVFVNGQLLRQVLSYAEMSSQSGTFHVRESSGGDAKDVLGVLTIHPPPSVDMSAATVEVALRPETLLIDQMTNLVIRNLTLRHASSELQTPSVVVTSSENILIDGCRVEWNNWNGLSIFRSAAVTIRDVRANWNGAGGVTGWRVRNLIVADTESSHNNWRGAWGGFFGWAVGQKFLSTHGARFIDYRAASNQATGLWLDVDIEDVVIERAEITDNWRGMFLEAVQGPLVLRDSVIRHNRGDGILTTTAANVTLARNRIEGNRDHQLTAPWTVDAHQVRVERDFETGRTLQLRMENWTITDNVIGGADDAILLGSGTWPPFLSSLVSARNRWYHTDPGGRFLLYPSKRDRPDSASFTGWQRISGQDLDSTMTSTVVPEVCSVSLVADSIVFDPDGGTGELAVTSRPSDCTWTAAIDVPWVTITGPSSGQGDALVSFRVAAHAFAGTRAGTLTVGNASLRITQHGAACSVVVTPDRVTTAAAGGLGWLSVSASTPDCAWTVSSDSEWLTVVDGGSGVATGRVTFEVTSNPGTTSRTGVLSVGGRRVVVEQVGAESVDDQCDVDVASSIAVDASGGRRVVAVAGASAECALQATSGADWITIVRSASDASVADVSFRIAPNPWPLTREGAVTVGDRAVRVVQHGRPPGGPSLDVNGDGFGDLLWQDAGGGWSITSFDAGLSPALGGQWRPGWSVAAGDFDADGYADLLLYSLETGEAWRGLNDRLGRFQWRMSLWRPGLVARLLDLDGDRRTDVFLLDPGTGEWAQALSPVDASQEFSYHTGRWAPGWEVFPGRFTSVDRTDLLLYNVHTGRWQLAVSDGRGDFTYRGGQAAPGWQPYPGDYDGDGRSDVFAYAPASGDWLLALSRGDGFATGAGRLGTGLHVRPADLDGDGRTDLLLYASATGDWSQAFVDGLTLQTVWTGRWAPGRELWVPDLDGDGRGDVLRYDPITGDYRVATATGSGGFAERLAGRWAPGLAIVASRAP